MSALKSICLIPRQMPKEQTNLRKKSALFLLKTDTHLMAPHLLSGRWRIYPKTWINIFLMKMNLISVVLLTLVALAGCNQATQTTAPPAAAGVKTSEKVSDSNQPAQVIPTAITYDQESCMNNELKVRAENSNVELYSELVKDLSNKCELTLEQVKTWSKITRTIFVQAPPLAVTHDQVTCMNYQVKAFKMVTDKKKLALYYRVFAMYLNQSCGVTHDQANTWMLANRSWLPSEIIIPLNSTQDSCMALKLASIKSENSLKPDTGLNYELSEACGLSEDQAAKWYQDLPAQIAPEVGKKAILDDAEPGVVLAIYYENGEALFQSDNSRGPPTFVQQTRLSPEIACGWRFCSGKKALLDDTYSGVVSKIYQDGYVELKVDPLDYYTQGVYKKDKSINPLSVYSRSRLSPEVPCDLEHIGICEGKKALFSDFESDVTIGPKPGLVTTVYDDNLIEIKFNNDSRTSVAWIGKLSPTSCCTSDGTICESQKLYLKNFSSSIAGTALNIYENGYIDFRSDEKSLQEDGIYQESMFTRIPR